jgi:hypothetical protein
MGKSTLHFTDLLQRTKIPFRWTTLEYDRDYFREVMQRPLEARPYAQVRFAEAPPPVGPRPEGSVEELEAVVYDRGKLSPFLAGHEADRQVNLDDYVTYPRGLGRRFDLIFVDGRKRRRCLLEAAALLKPRGVALLHDAYRAHYHCSFAHFKSQRMLGEILWIGSQCETNFLEWIL